MIRRTGAELTIELLQRQGISQLAGIPGGANLPLYDALSRSAIRHVLARHEQGAGFIAQGMARTTGSPAVCFATSGPGATNVLTALADAYLDSIPVICITGQVPLPMIGTDAFQEVDIYGMSLPVTKHNFLVRRIEDLLEVIPEAFRIAASGRPGPVLIDIPKDVQQATLEFASWPEPGTADPVQSAPQDVLERAHGLLASAQRPILYLGGGVIHAGASEMARQLAERCDLPTVMTLMALGVLPDGHPLSLGMLGMHGAAATNHALHRSDLLIALGARFDDRATGRLGEFCPDAQVIHLDIDASEIHKLRRADVPLRGDLGATLEKLLGQVRPQRRESWREEIASLRHRYPEPLWGASLERPQDLIRRVGQEMGPDAVVVTDVGQHQMWTAQVYPFSRPRQWLTSGGLGTMGFGLPAAIGAALAEPQRPVVCFSGDGSILMNIQELATATECKLNIKLVLLNNQALGLVRQQQDLFYAGNRFASGFDGEVRFCDIARGFGWSTLDLAETGSDPHRLAEALAKPGPQFIHVPINGEERVYPMVPPGGANHQMLTGEEHECE
ncbi:MAG: acetolactate synthase large subunit [Candidatus Thiodiazotropha sp.]